MRKFATTFLIAASFIVAELHSLFANNTSVENWIWRRPTPMLVEWNVKYLCDQLVWICIALAGVLYVRNRVNLTSFKMLLCWTILDLFNYLYSFKTINYGPTYFWLAGIYLLLFYGPRLGRYLWQNLPHPK